MMTACSSDKDGSSGSEASSSGAVVERFFTELITKKDPNGVASLLSDDFVSHEPSIDGKKGMVDFAAAQAADNPGAGIVEMIHTVVQGDLVVKHYTYSNEPSKGAELDIVDFFRVKDGKITEYWDVIKPVS